MPRSAISPKRYGLKQLSLAGRTPEAEPDAAELERLVATVEASGATTVFAEPLVSPGLAETVAREAGVDGRSSTRLEGLSEERLDAGRRLLIGDARRTSRRCAKALGCR